eukprot:3068927-Lingulodinium_polyedra.AAC.1
MSARVEVEGARAKVCAGAEVASIEAAWAPRAACAVDAEVCRFEFNSGGRAFLRRSARGSLVAGRGN